MAQICPKNVDNHITIIHGNPLRKRESFETQWTNLLFVEGLFNMVRNRPHLPIGIGGAEDEIIGD